MVFRFIDLDVAEFNMAINSIEKVCDKIEPTATKSSCSKSSNQSSLRLLKTDYTADCSVSSSNHDKSKKRKNVSPYFTEDRIQMLSRITEKRFVRKKTTDIISSYPLAVNIYKASSDEFKALKKSKKVKKSVLTLPNEPAPLPQTCTVSDMNESEYFDDSKDERKTKPKKRRAIATNRKPQINMNKAMEIFDRDAEYCSRLNIDLDSSSTEMINQYTGDGIKKTIKRRNNIPKKSDIQAHDVWAMLRNINRFPFRPSPPMSEYSIPINKRNKNNKRRNSQMDTKFIETCTTEQFTYFSNLVDNSGYNSQSSIDRITVIDKQDEYQELREGLFKNKIPPKLRSPKNVKKITSNANNCTKAKHTNVGNNDKLFHQHDVNPTVRNIFSKSLQNKAQSQEAKLMLTYDTSNNRGCTDSCFYCQNNISTKESKESDDSEDHMMSDSSKGDIRILASVKDHHPSDKISSCNSRAQINGITKVVLSKGPNTVLSNKSETTKRIPRSVTTMPSEKIYPKLTQTDIKRRIANMKFPLVILAKDQLTSAPFRVTNYEPPQFAGLEEHAWPFMQNWRKKNIKVATNANKENSRFYEKIATTAQGMKVDCIAEHNNGMKVNKRKNSLAFRDKSAIQAVPITNAENMNIKPPKTKPMNQFKERMLQFLHKKSSFDDDNKKIFPKDLKKRRELFNNAVDVSTNTLVLSKEKDEIIYKKEDKMLKYLPCDMKQPKAEAKGRWASDFIDNVIKKLKSGVYYNQEEKEISRKSCCLTKEDSVQTEIHFNEHDLCKNCIQRSGPVIEEINKSDPVPYLPGFDDSLSDLQIESINTNQIAIKHCINNIIVQFDVAMPSQINHTMHVNQSVSCIPVSVTESNTRIFKSKITIVNAILPAELCSILPKMIRKIVDAKVVTPKIVDKVESHLSTIAELTRCESGDSMTHLIPVNIEISPELRSLGQGKFSHNVSTITMNNSNKSKICLNYFEKLNFSKIADTLPNIKIHLLFNCQKDPFVLEMFDSHKSIKLPNHQKTSACMELQPYSSFNRQVFPVFTKLKFAELAAEILSIKNFTIKLSMPLINELNFLCTKNTKNIINMDLNTHKNKVTYIISDVNVDSFYNDFQEPIEGFKENPSFFNFNLKKQNVNASNKKYTERSQKNKCENCKSGVEYCVANVKNRKKSFVRLYKKCKSMSNISNERSSTALSKIANLDDFFQALGSGKTLASVFDATTERKILTSIKEMKNWINEITPRQALLILLLANKKDTSNLVRYRPVILQGIAVKRITRVSELDLEIEVIERENLNTFSQYEGISYVPASIENQDSLLEELTWIAKTTASDYQKPFDESSERLLKSLLEKRKKLNPSYLRVMARYVGLGMVKSPK